MSEMMYAEAEKSAETMEKAVFPAYSVLMSVYCLEKPSYLSLSLESMIGQTVPPYEIVLVKDGPLTDELDAVIEEKISAHPGLIKVVSLPVNGGLGNALNEGIKVCSCEFIARMDSDDISREDRMEKQLTYLLDHPGTDILSGAVSEFDGTTDNVTSVRRVPETDADIKQFALTRSPFNHMAVLYRKSKVEEAGLYRTDLKRVEDHDLWMRMIRKGALCANLSEELVYARCGDAMHKKRHGMENAKALYRFYQEMYVLGEITYFHFLTNVFFACGLQLMPAWMHKLCYQFIRSDKRTVGMGKKTEKALLPKGEKLLYTPSDEENRALQEELLAIYDDVAAVCEKHHLTIILSGGSCLGAVRHKGFIPWDDDMDAVMPRADYDRLKEIFRAELAERYELQVPAMTGVQVTAPFMKIVKKGSARREIDTLAYPGERGLYLDIVPMEYAPAEPLKRFFKGIFVDALKFFAVSAEQYAYRNPVTRAYRAASFGSMMKYRFRMGLGFIANLIGYDKWFLWYDQFSQGERSDIVTFPGGTSHYLGEAMEKSTFLPPVKGEFEGRTVLLPRRAHPYLHNHYGSDYMLLPPAEKRRAHMTLKPEYGNRA